MSRTLYTIPCLASLLLTKFNKGLLLYILRDVLGQRIVLHSFYHINKGFKDEGSK